MGVGIDISRLRYAAWPFLARHCFAPAGLVVTSHSFSNKFLKEQVAPLRWRLRPSNFRTAGDGIGSNSCPELAFPPEALVFQGAAFRLRPHQRRVTGTVRLPKVWAAGDQRDGLFVVHGHAEECLADIFRRRDGSGFAVRTFRVDVDQAHLNRASGSAR